ncbi:MAG: hypothetical protein HFE98_10010 [Ruminiclostridium sp.]|nr:hypothetical protein [Ruminiclostridium sp.]
MEKKYQTVLITAIALTVFAAVFVSFGLPALGGTPKVTLPDISQDAAGETEFLPVEVTPKTVQSVIGTLSRPEAYHRETQINYYWHSGNQSGSTTCAVEIWADGSYVKTELRPTNGSVEHRLVGNGKLCIWYAGDNNWKEMAAPEGGGDLAQRLPTYEDVLQLDPTEITAAGYETKDNIDCIYVQVCPAGLDTLDCYWIEMATGLLYRAETWEGGALAYEMVQTSLQPLEEGVRFALPDGTVLHTSAAVGQ